MLYLLMKNVYIIKFFVEKKYMINKLTHPYLTSSLKEKKNTIPFLSIMIEPKKIKFFINN